MLRLAGVLAVGCLVLGLSCCGEEKADPDLDALRAYVDRYLEQTGVQSVALAVAKDGEIAWEAGFGLANVEQAVPATANTCYPIASVNKNVTATALMTLVEQGKVGLDKPANDYLGDLQLRAFKGESSAATVRTLLQHTSGIPLHYEAYFEDQIQHRISTHEMIRRYGILMTPPGERFQYSSLGYGTLEYIIEQVSGRSYADYVSEALFKPLGMDGALFLESLPADVAVEYTGDDTPARLALGVRPGGEIYCSAHDMIRYAMFHLKDHLRDQEQILSDNLIDRMQQDFDGNAEGAQYALGWRLEEVGGYRVFSHNGGGLGCDIRMAIIPEADMAVVVLANSRKGNSTALSDRLAREFLPGFERDRWRDRFARLLKGRKRPTTVPLNEIAGTWAGVIETYKGPVPVEFVVKPSGMSRLRRTDEAAGEMGWIDARRAMSLRDGLMEAMFDARVLGLDDNRPERYLLLRLLFDGTELYGSANAGNSTELVYCVPCYISMTRSINVPEG
jgi:CubicO group peptidase (beta-lactamase class C family)